MNAQHLAHSANTNRGVAGHVGESPALVITAGSDGRAANIAVIEGAMGTGKSALLGRMAATATEAGSLVLRASASAWESDFPLGVVRQVFELLLATAPARDRATWLSGAAALVPQVLSLGDDDGDPGHAASHAVFWLAVNISRRRPLTILIDDLQWADLASLRWLIHLARRMISLPLTVVVTSGSGGHADHAELVAALLTEVRRMPQAGLSTSAAGQMIAGSLTGATAPIISSAAAVLPAASGRAGQHADFGPGALTAHEHRLIGLAVNGSTNSEIAQQFGVTRRAVEFHFTQIYRKLGIARRPQLYRFAHVSAA
jgi:DNA-binding NarL/FixJ family response regulator